MTATPAMMIWPMLAHMLLVLILFLSLSRQKKRAVREGTVDLKKTALDNSAWPDHVLKVSNNIQNQFQVPVLFYALCLAFAALGSTTLIALGLAWLFVISRVVHSYIHTTSNKVPVRMKVFILGYLLIAAMAVTLAVQLAV